MPNAGTISLQGSLARTDADQSFLVAQCRLWSPINGVRADWQRHLRLAREKLGFSYIRAHGTLNSEFQIARGASAVAVSCRPT